MSITIALFGTGQMGRSAVAVLSRRLPEARFRLFDISRANLDQAALLVPDRCSSHWLDISRDAIDLAAADIAINFAGPFYQGSNQIAQAALRARVPYIDVCDDAEGTETVLSLHEMAVAAGVPIITGGGLSPGISNWLACKLLAEGPELNGIQIVWITREKDPGGLAVLRHMLHMAVTPCPVWRDGRLEHTKGFVPETAVRFVVPAPFGEIEAYDTAHPEPVTLGRTFPDLKLVECKGSLSPNWANAAFSTLGRIGFGHSEMTVEIGGAEVSPAEVLWKLLWKRHAMSGRGERVSHTQVNVIGLCNGVPRRMASLTDVADMSRGTGLGVASAALTLLEGGASPGATGVETLSHTRGLAIFAELCAAESAFSGGIEWTDL
jgi:lysine 6-dehydrogenase